MFKHVSQIRVEYRKKILKGETSDFLTEERMEQLEGIDFEFDKPDWTTKEKEWQKRMQRLEMDWARVALQGARKGTTLKPARGVMS